MKAEDAEAALAVHRVEKQTRLTGVIDQPAYRYYFGGGLVRTILGFISLCISAWLLIRQQIPGWGLITLGLAIFTLTENIRQRERFDALLQLLEMERDR